jgi:hypothetical protein
VSQCLRVPVLVCVFVGARARVLSVWNSVCRCEWFVARCVLAGSAHEHSSHFFLDWNCCKLFTLGESMPGRKAARAQYIYQHACVYVSVTA